MPAYLGVRHNETTRVAAVLEHLRDGNSRSAIDALVGLWLEDPERPDTIDGAAIDAWQAIEQAGAIDGAIAATLAVVRAGNRIRPHAFIELTERVSNEVLIELAEQVLAASWSADPYLAAVLLRLAERAQGPAFLELLERHRERFESDTQLWELALFVMTTSLIGDNATVAKWFESWRDRKPRMWLVAAYAGTLFQGVKHADLTNKKLRRLIEIATAACDTLAWDDSVAVFVCFKLVSDLQEDRLNEFETSMREHRALIVKAIAASRLQHPIVRFANALKHAHPVIGEQLDDPRARLEEKDWRESLINRQLAYVVSDLSAAVGAMLEALDLYARLDALPRGDRKIRGLMHAMKRLDEHGAGGWFRTAWFRLLGQRATWQQRVF